MRTGQCHWKNGNEADWQPFHYLSLLGLDSVSFSFSIFFFFSLEFKFFSFLSSSSFHFRPCPICTCLPTGRKISFPSFIPALLSLPLLPPLFTVYFVSCCFSLSSPLIEGAGQLLNTLISLFDMNGNILFNWNFIPEKMIPLKNVF